MSYVEEKTKEQPWHAMNSTIQVDVPKSLSDDGAAITPTKSVQAYSTSSTFIPYHYDYPRYYRWAMLVCGTVLAFILGAPFMNWPPLERMFDASGAYNSICSPSSQDYREGDDGILYCKEKQVEISKIAGFAQGIMFIFAFVAGLMLDCLGSKACSTIGSISIFIGWLLIAFSGVDFNGFKAGVFFLAAGTDACIFGFLSIANLFPGYNATVIAVFGAARSLTFGVPLVMEAMFEAGLHLRTISLLFCAVLLASMVIIVLLIPRQSFPRLPPGVMLDFEPGEGKLSLRKAANRRREKITFKKLMKSTVEQVAGWYGQAKNLGYIVFLAVAIMALIRNGYYMASHNEHLHDVRNLYDIMSPLSFIPCPLLGMFADKVSAALCIAVLAASGCLSLFVVLFSPIWLQVLSVMANWIFISFVSSQFYCYGAAVFTQQHMGKLVGFALALGGALSLTSQNMYSFASGGDNQLLAMDILVVVVELLALTLAIGLYIYVERPIRRRANDFQIDAPKKAAPETGETSDYP